MIANHFTITHKICDLQSLMIMITENLSKVIHTRASKRQMQSTRPIIDPGPVETSLWNVNLSIFSTVAANETCLLDRGRFDALALVKYGNLGPENHRKSDKNISHFPSPLHLPRIAGAWSVQQSTRAVNWTSRNFTMAGHCPYYHFQVEGLPLGTVKFREVPLAALAST